MDHREPPSDNPDRDAAGGLAPPSDPAGSLAPPDGSPSTAVEPPSPGAPSSTDELSSAVAALTEDDVEPATRRRLLGRVVREEVRERGIKKLFRPKEAIRWVVDAVTDVAPQIPVRNLDTLRAHYPGLEGEALADRLVRNAARVTAGIGAASGGVSAVEWAVTPTLLSVPVLLAAETVAVVAVEMKLIGELHEVYGCPIEGNGAQRAAGLLQAWAHRRGVNPLSPGRGIAAALGTATRKELRERLVRRYGRNLGTQHLARLDDLSAEPGEVAPDLLAQRQGGAPVEEPGATSPGSAER